MTENEKELITFIRESGDPARAIIIAVDIISQYLAGKTFDEIAESRGIPTSEL